MQDHDKASFSVVAGASSGIGLEQAQMQRSMAEPHDTKQH
jgi:NADP-dependent 3-hydroxy acid dehydrogenase YdfG